MKKNVNNKNKNKEKGNQGINGQRNFIFVSTDILNRIRNIQQQQRNKISQHKTGKYGDAQQRVKDQQQSQK